MLLAGLRSLTVLAVVAASLVLLVWQLASDTAIDFARYNVLEREPRILLIVMMLSAVVLSALAGAVYVTLGSVPAVLRLRRLAMLASPLMLAALVPPILSAQAWPDPLTAALAIAVFTLIAEQLLRVSFQAIDDSARNATSYNRLRRRRWLLVTIIAALGYCGYMSTYTLFAHFRFQTYNFDLGQYDNVFWNALHGRPLVCTPLSGFSNWSSLSSHADFGVFALLPFYAIYPHAETLLVLQSCILGLGAIPLYLFAVRRLPPWSACALAVAYLLYAPMHGANFYDFHLQPVAATFVLLAIWAVDARRWIWLVFSFAIAISCREDISVGLTMLGLYLTLVRHRAKAGLWMALAGATYFVVVRFVIMPLVGPGWFSDIYKDLYPPKGPNSYGGVMQTLLTNPSFVFRTLLTTEKLKYFLQITAPVAFLPLRRAYLLPALLPGAMFTLLTTAYPPTTDIAFQYSGHFTPYVFTASAIALASYRGARPAVFRSVVAALAIGTFLTTKHWGAIPPSGSLKGGFSLISFATPTRTISAKFATSRSLPP